MSHIRISLAVGAVVLLTAASRLSPKSATAAQDPEPARGPSLVSVAEGIDCVYSRSGGNVAVVRTSAGSLVIDTNLAQFEAEFVALVDKAAGERPRFVVNTHWHGDHAGNNSVFGRRQVPIVAHDRVRRRLAGDTALEGRVAEGTPVEALPVLTFEESLDLHLGAQDVRLAYYGPAHTDGDIVAWFPNARVVHMGDLFFEGRFPFIDLGSGGTVRGYIETVGRILAELRTLEAPPSVGPVEAAGRPAEGAAEAAPEPAPEDRAWKIIPGHGRVTGTAELARYHEMLVGAVGRVEAAQAAGQTLEAMLASNLLEEYAAWSWDFVSTERFLEAVATDLERDPGR